MAEAAVAQEVLAQLAWIVGIAESELRQPQVGGLALGDVLRVSQLAQRDLERSAIAGSRDDLADSRPGLGIWASVLLEAPEDPEDCPRLSLLAGLAVAAAGGKRSVSS